MRRVKPTNPGTKDKGRSTEEKISKFSADQIAKSIPMNYFIYTSQGLNLS